MFGRKCDSKGSGSFREIGTCHAWERVRISSSRAGLAASLKGAERRLPQEEREGGFAMYTEAATKSLITGIDFDEIDVKA
jgi:hypothetical protein